MKKLLLALALITVPALAVQPQGEILGCDQSSAHYKQCMKEWDKQKGAAAKKADKARESQEFAARQTENRRQMHEQAVKGMEVNRAVIDAPLPPGTTRTPKR